MDTTQFCSICEDCARWAHLWKRAAKKMRTRSLGWYEMFCYMEVVSDVLYDMVDDIGQIAKEELDIIEREGGVCRGYKRILAVLSALDEQES